MFYFCACVTNTNIALSVNNYYGAVHFGGGRGGQGQLRGGQGHPRGQDQLRGGQGQLRGGCDLGGGFRGRARGSVWSRLATQRLPEDLVLTNLTAEGPKQVRDRVQPPPEAKQGKIYLGNLPPEGISNEDIETHFAPFGSVAEVVRPVNKSKNNEPKNFAFVTFNREERPSSWSRRDPQPSRASPSPSKRGLPRTFFFN